MERLNTQLYTKKLRCAYVRVTCAQSSARARAYVHVGVVTAAEDRVRVDH